VNLYFRLFVLLLQSLWTTTRSSVVGANQRSFRVLPNDLDLNLHMNNGRYLTVMDLGRLDFMRQTGLLWPTLRRGWLPVLGATQMVYLRPLKFWQSYSIETEMEYWDEKWFVMRQRFWSGGKLMAVGRVRGLMRSSQGNIPPQQILEAAGSRDLCSPPASPDLTHWLQSLSPSEVPGTDA
jgi:acyl-CoA thioesterase FadM